MVLFLLYVTYYLLKQFIATKNTTALLVNFEILFVLFYFFPFSWPVYI